MTKVDNNAMDAALLEGVKRRIAEDNSQSDRSMKPIEVVLTDQVIKTSQVNLARERLLHSQECLSTRNNDTITSRHGTYSEKIRNWLDR